MATRKPDPPENLDLFDPRPDLRPGPRPPERARAAPAPTSPAPVALQPASRTTTTDEGLVVIVATQHHATASALVVEGVPGVGAAEAVVLDAGGPRSYRVCELVRLASRTLESRFADVWVEGEISNLKSPGHLYFTLKDEEGQLPAVMFRGSASRLRFRPTDGLKVRARGRLAIYDAQGKLQLYVEAMEPVGLGAMQLAFEQLKRRLAAEGLFEPARKRPLPYLPGRIGIATSPTGAAVRDIIRVALRRGPVKLLVAPCLVQGDQAPADIVRALAALQRQPDVALIIVGRGGGSAEDLWAFNDERVARAIAACRVPVISAVGHEVDFTIADFVADKRAATPSQAAELAVPVHAELVRVLEDLALRLGRAGRRTVGDARLRLDDQLQAMAGLLQRRIDVRRNALAAAEGRLRAFHPRARLARDRALLDGLGRRIARHPAERLARARHALSPLVARLHAAMQQAMVRRQRALEHAAGKLDALSPLKVLDRGYGLVRRPSGGVVTRAEQLAPGDRVAVQLARGAITAEVISVEADPADAEAPSVKESPAARPAPSDDGRGER